MRHRSARSARTCCADRHSRDFSTPGRSWDWLAVAGPDSRALLGRRQARRLAFPNLRFRRPPFRRLSVATEFDVALLALRVAIVAAAAIALAQLVCAVTARARASGAAPAGARADRR